MTGLARATPQPCRELCDQERMITKKMAHWREHLLLGIDYYCIVLMYFGSVVLFAAMPIKPLEFK